MMVDGMSDVEITSAISAGGQALFNGGDVITGDTSTWSKIGGGSAPVPEPTSALLMLLGVAGLALRRKQA